MSFYTTIEDCDRLKQGDVIIIPADKAKGLALTPSSLNKYGVSSGFTSRSDNDGDTLKKLYTDVLAKGETVAFVVMRAEPARCWDDTATRYGVFFGNKAGQKTRHDVQLTSKATLRRISLDLLSGKIPVSKYDVVTASAYTSPQTLQEAFNRISPISLDDVFETRCDGKDKRLVHILDIAGSLYSQPVVNRYSLPHSPDPASTGISPTQFKESVYNELGMNAALYKTESFVLTRKALLMMGSRGAKFLRPSAGVFNTITTKVAEYVSERSSSGWAAHVKTVKETLNLLKTLPAETASRAKSWSKRAYGLRKSAYVSSGRGAMGREIMKGIK